MDTSSGGPNGFVKDRITIGMVVNGAPIGTGQYEPVIRGGFHGLTADHLREWDSRLGQLRADLLALVQPPPEPDRAQEARTGMTE